MLSDLGRDPHRRYGRIVGSVFEVADAVERVVWGVLFGGVLTVLIGRHRGVAHDGRTGTLGGRRVRRRSGRRGGGLLALLCRLATTWLATTRFATTAAAANSNNCYDCYDEEE